MNTQENTEEKSVPGRTPLFTSASSAASPPDVSTLAEHDGAEAGDDDGAAELAEEIERAGDDAELVRQDGILDQHRGQRIHRPDPAADEEQQRPKPRRARGSLGAAARTARLAMATASPAIGNRL